MDSDDEIIYDSLLIQVYRSGRVERSPIATETTPAGFDPATGVSSKDVVVDSEIGVSGRLYLPSAPGHGQQQEQKKKLPVLVYYHGGGFCLGSAFGSLFHHYLNALVAKADVLAVSVDYRLAPEHPIAAAYDDSWLALRWVAAHADGRRRGEPWLADRADLSRVFLAGDSAGANIAHNVALRAGGVDGAQLRGLVLVHPYFLSPAAVESEARNPAVARDLVDVWAMVSSSAGLEDPRINPPAAWGGAAGRRRVLVCVGGKDVLRDRGVAYYNKLKEEGGEVKLYEAVGKGHTFHILDPDCEEALAQDQVICMFINQAISDQ